jgi:hypothetical protein
VSLSLEEGPPMRVLRALHASFPIAHVLEMSYMLLA